MMFDSEELQRYSRHFNLKDVGLAGQQRLKSAKVLCIGAGGLGSPLLLYLAAAGIGTIGIIDDDIVDVTNLQRQILYTSKDLGKKKIEIARAKLIDLNPHLNVNTYDQRLTKDNALDIIKQYDIVADGTDNFVTRYIVNDACFHLKKPNVYASIFQFEGQCSVFFAEHGPCYRCLYDAPPPPGLIPNCVEGGVLGVLPGIIGSLQATEVIKLILGIGSSLIGRLLVFDALAMRFQEFYLQKNPNCRLCKHQQDFASLPHHDMHSCNSNTHADSESLSVQELHQLRQLQADFILLDVREPLEYNICNLGGLLIPLSQLSNKVHELDKSKLIIVHCKSGGRSQRALKILREAGCSSVKNLTGGILAWAREIDSSITQY